MDLNFGQGVIPCFLYFCESVFVSLSTIVPTFILVFKNLVKYLKLFKFRPMSGLRRLKFFGLNSQKMALLPITLSHTETSIFFSRVVVIVFFVTFR